MHVLDQAWDTVKREFDAARTQAERSARSQVTSELNQSLRRLRQYRNQSEWASAVVDAVGRFVPQVALFELNNGTLALRKQQNLQVREDFAFPAGAGAAFATAIDTKDSVVALRTASEVTADLAAPGTAPRAHIIPILNETRVVAVLFASGEDQVDLNAVELIAGVASAVLERRANASLHAQISLPVVPKPQDTPQKRFLPGWADLSEDQRGLHIRAQRFSRVAVAQMQLSKPEACRAGREHGDLYVFLKQEIDKARENYRKQFLTVPSMVDYLHLELVRTAADADESKLGAEYPGPLV